MSAEAHQSLASMEPEPAACEATITQTAQRIEVVRSLLEREAAGCG